MTEKRKQANTNKLHCPACNHLEIGDQAGDYVSGEAVPIRPVLKLPPAHRNEPELSA